MNDEEYYNIYRSTTNTTATANYHVVISELDAMWRKRKQDNEQVNSCLMDWKEVLG